MNADHGYHRYSSKENPCRCTVCRKAKADYMRARRAKARANAQPGVKVAGILHGARAGYEEHGCRCSLCVLTYNTYGHCGRKAAERPRRRCVRRGGAA